MQKKVYKWLKLSIKGFLSFLLFHLMLNLTLPRINKFIPIIEKRRNKLNCLIVRFRCDDKIRLFSSPELRYITLLSLEQKILNLYSYTVHQNKLIDMFINNINGVINKNLCLFFFPSDNKLAWKAKQEQQELTKKSTVFE